MIKVDNDPKLAKLAEDIEGAIDDLEEFDGHHELLQFESIVNTNDILSEDDMVEVEVEFFRRYGEPDGDIEDALTYYFAEIETALIEFREKEEAAIAAAMPLEDD